MRKQQSGSIVIYTMIGIVLAGLLVAGIVFSQKRAEQLADRHVSAEQSSESNKPEVGQQDQQSEKEKNDQAERKRREAEESQRQQEEKQDREQAEKEARERDLAEKAAQTQREAEQAPAASEGPMARTGGAQASDLPTTGPISDALGAVSGLLAIAAAGYVYYHYGRRP